MKIIDEEKYFKNKIEILEFIKRNENVYQDLISFLEPAILLDLCLKLPASSMPPILSQVLSKFGVYKDGSDHYLEMLKLLEKYSFLEGNCCEIGSGRYPRLAELTAPQLKLREGTLTIYDPNTLFSNIENVTIIKEKFTKDTNIDRFDTLYGLYPCEAAITIAEKAFEEDKNLMLAFCSCDNSTKQHQKWIGKYWAEDFCMDYREKYGKEAEIINWPSTTGLDFPIMVRRSNKQKSKVK